MASFIICGTASGEQQRLPRLPVTMGLRAEVQSAASRCCVVHWATEIHYLHISHIHLKQLNHSGSYFRSCFKSSATLRRSYINTKRFVQIFLLRAENGATAMYHPSKKLGLEHLLQHLAVFEYTYFYFTVK